METKHLAAPEDTRMDAYSFSTTPRARPGKKHKLEKHDIKPDSQPKSPVSTIPTPSNLVNTTI